MAREPEVVEFDGDEPGPALERMAAVAAAGKGWINFHPFVPEEDEPPPTQPLFALLAARGPEIPVCTWTPPGRNRKGETEASLGVQHAAGTKAAATLAAAGHPVPPGWRVLQDHPRRGLVVSVPLGTAPGAVLAWLLGAGARLCPVRTTGRWAAAVY